ncbi:MAG: HypC/HybG/HupF family hydrogenase formation chaperone [Gemmatimonadales bacterium]
MTSPDVSPTGCDPDRGCITCSDEGVAMRVTSVDGPEGVALCSDAAGRQAEVQTELVGGVEVGDALLVHAGVALVHLGRGPS